MKLTTDDALKLALSEYARAICEFLSTKMTPGANPKELLRTYASDFTFDEHEKADPYPINRLPEAERYKKEIRNHPIIGKQVGLLVGTSASRSLVTVWTVLLQFMTSLIDKQNGVSFSKRAYNSIFKEMTNFFKSDTIQIQDVVPLGDFMSDIDSIDLGNSWRLGKFSEDIHALWWHVGFRPIPVGPPSHFRVAYGLLKEHEVDRFFGGRKLPRKRVRKDFKRLEDEINTIVSALRLLKEGRVLTRARTTRAIGWHVGYPAQGPSWNPTIPETHEPTFMLLKDEVPELNKILNSLKFVRKDKAFQVALGRLNYSVERSDTKLEDRILDTMIGFESLFLGDRGELSYRLGLRVALFLGKSLEERKEYFGFIKRSYRLRSAIIHGYDEDKVQNDLKGLEMDLHQAGLKLEKLLRKALRKYLEKAEEGKNRADIISSLDNRILNDASISEIHEINPELDGVDLINTLRDLDGTPKEIIEILLEKKVVKSDELEG